MFERKFSIIGKAYRTLTKLVKFTVTSCRDILILITVSGLLTNELLTKTCAGPFRSPL